MLFPNVDTIRVGDHVRVWGRVRATVTDVVESSSDASHFGVDEFGVFVSEREPSNELGGMFVPENLLDSEDIEPIDRRA